MSHPLPLVSVIISTYNREKYVRECLDSVFAQTYKDMEVIVVDDASTDKTVDIVRKYGDRVRLVVRGVNSGLPAVPRNQGLGLAQGKYVAFLDSDDVWLPEKIERQVEQLERHPEFVLSHTFCHVIDESGRVHGVRHEGMLAESISFCDLVEHCYITLSTVVVRRELLTEQKLKFNETRAYRIGEDYELFLRLLKKGNAGCVTDVCASYRRANSGISQERRAWRSQPIDVPFYLLLIMRKDIWGDLIEQSLIEDRLLSGCNQNSTYWRDRGYPLRALYFCLKGILINPFEWRCYGEGLKSLGSYVVRRKEMRARRNARMKSNG